MRPASPCHHPGCPELATDQGLCLEHLAQSRHEMDQRRGSAASRGYGSRWQVSRAQYLRDHPLCVKCQEQGRLTPATTVDHIIPHRGDYELMWDESNWQSLCTEHHNLKTATEDGAFGRETR